MTWILVQLLLRVELTLTLNQIP